MVALKNFDIDSHYKSMRDGKLAYSFRGVLTEGIMEFVFQDIEEALINKPEPRLIRKRIFNVLVELIQNIYKYTSELALEANEVMVIVQKKDNIYEIISGNYLEKNVIKTLQTRVSMINYLTGEQRDELYRGVLTSGLISRQNGAGLGFIDVARKSKNDLYYQFDNVDERYSFFTVKAFVSTES